jgi:SAM-dependent methyltransferase
LCSNCNILRQRPIPTSRKISSFYDNNYQNYKESKSIFLTLISKFYYKFFAYFLKVSKNSLILDYGCGTAQVLRNLELMGYKNLYGYDVIKPSLKNTMIKFFDNVEFLKKKKFDLIILNHVIEHVSDPRSLLLFLKTLLKKNGKIIGQTPNYSDLTFVIFGKYWGALHFPYHINLFSRIGLVRLVKKLNLFIKTSPSIMPTGWSMSLENIIKNIFSIKSKGRTKFYSIILILFLPVSIIFYILSGRTSIINFTIQNK